MSGNFPENIFDASFQMSIFPVYFNLEKKSSSSSIQLSLPTNYYIPTSLVV